MRKKGEDNWNMKVLFLEVGNERLLARQQILELIEVIESEQWDEQMMIMTVRKSTTHHNNPRALKESKET